MQDAIVMAWKEDVGSGDITSAACVPADAVEAAGFLVKGDGVLAGLAVAEAVFAYGASGAGKTHTMQGTPTDPGNFPLC